MEKLSERFLGKGKNHVGWEFIQVKREGMVAMYERVSCDTGRSHYEVIEVQESKGGIRVFGGVEIEYKPKECYPRDEAFGNLGWCYGDRDGAEGRFSWLVDRIRDRELSRDGVI